MKIAIIEDLQSDYLSLKEAIDTELCRQKIDFNIYHFNSGSDMLEGFEPGKYDLFFLDILLDNSENGMNVARQLRERGCNSQIVFTTGERDYAVESYEIHALDYLVKPFDRERVSSVLMRFIEINHAKRYITIMTSDGQLHFCSDDLMWAESGGHKTILHLSNGKDLTIMQSLESFVSMLPPQQFFFICCRGVLVNIGYINILHNNDAVLKNGQNIPVSRRKYNELKQLISEYAVQKTREAMGFE